jgi:hypothetical protein
MQLPIPPVSFTSKIIKGDLMTYLHRRTSRFDNAGLRAHDGLMELIDLSITSDVEVAVFARCHK